MYEYTGQRLNFNGTIDMEINHLVYGIIPFTASPDDPEEHGRLLFADAQATALPYVAALPTFEQRKLDVNVLRDQAIAAGMPYNFPEGPGTVQLRNPADISNVLGISASAQVSILVEDDKPILFRSSEDITHTLTAIQALDMGLAVSAFMSGHYATAWSHKDAMKQLTGQALADYDITTGWSN
jgi:hypothetical protein